MTGLRGTAARRASSAAVLRDLAERVAAGAVGDAAPELQERLVALVREAVDVTAELVRGSRVCAACGAALVRKAYESPSTFARRRTCDQRCNGALRSRVAVAAAAAVVPESKECRACGRVFHRRLSVGRYETPGDFAVRSCCSRACAAALARREQGASGTPAARPVARSVARRGSGRSVVLSDPRVGRWVRVEAAEPLEVVGVVSVNGVVFDASVCEVHGEQRGFFGCPACNASAARRRAERARPVTPHPEGR